MAAGSTVISAEVGDTAQPSAVSINGATILAKPGGDAFNDGEGDIESTVGGDGYSGGSDKGYMANNETFVFKGGAGGGDGEGPQGGQGTGEDVTQYTFTRWDNNYIGNIPTEAFDGAWQLYLCLDHQALKLMPQKHSPRQLLRSCEEYHGSVVPHVTITHNIHDTNQWWPSSFVDSTVESCLFLPMFAHLILNCGMPAGAAAPGIYLGGRVL